MNELTLNKALDALFLEGQRFCYQCFLPDEKKIENPGYGAYYPHFIEYSRTQAQSGIYDGLEKAQYIVINPFKPEAEKRNRDEILGRQAYTIEHDIIALEHQIPLIESLLPIENLTIVFSGNKSYHCSLVFERILSEDEDKEGEQILGKLFPFCDFGVVHNQAGFCRMPNGTRYFGQSKTAKQKILAIGERIQSEYFFTHIKKLTEGILRFPDDARKSLAIIHGKINKIAHQEGKTQDEINAILKGDECQKALNIGWDTIAQNLLDCGYEDSMLWKTIQKIVVLQDAIYKPIGFDFVECVSRAKTKKASQIHLVCQSSTHAKTEKATQIPLGSQKSSCVPSTQSNTRNDRIKARLQTIDCNMFLDILRQYCFVHYVRQSSNGSISIACPLGEHPEQHSRGSAYIQVRKDGIAKISCHSDRCSLQKKSRNILNILEDIFPKSTFSERWKMVFNEDFAYQDTDIESDSGIPIENDTVQTEEKQEESENFTEIFQIVNPQGKAQRLIVFQKQDAVRMSEIGFCCYVCNMDKQSALAVRSFHDENCNGMPMPILVLNPTMDVTTAQSIFGYNAIVTDVPTLAKDINFDEYIKANIRLYGIAPIARERSQAKATMEQVIYNAIVAKHRKAVIIDAPTGCGKSELARKFFATYQESATYFTDSKKAVRLHHTLFAENKGKKYPDITVRKITADENPIADDSMERHGKQEASFPKNRRDITTYGYLGLKPNGCIRTICGYSATQQKEGLATASLKILDELHSLLLRGMVQIPLCAAYEKTSDQWNRIDTTRYPDADVAYRCKPLRGEHDWDFTSKLPIESVMDMAMQFEGRSSEEWQNFSSFRQVEGTLFIDVLPYIHKNMALPIEGNADFAGYIATRLRFMYKPRIQIEFPIAKKDFVLESEGNKEPIKQGQSVWKYRKKIWASCQAIVLYENPGLQPDQVREKTMAKYRTFVQEPKTQPGIPYLVGFDILPIIQLLQAGDKIIGLSATLAEGQKEHLQFAFKLYNELYPEKAWDYEFHTFSEPLVRFNVTVFNCEEQGSIATISKLLLANARKRLILAVTHKQFQAKELYYQVNKEPLLGDEFVLYNEGSFAEDGMGNVESSEKKLRSIIAYYGATILQGIDLPEYDMVICDHRLFVAKASMFLDGSEPSKVIAHNFIKCAIIQIMGRVFRCPYHTVGGVSPKEVVLIFFGTNGQDIPLDMGICNQVTSIKSSEAFSWYSHIESDFSDSVIQAIQDQRDGKQPENWLPKDATKIKKKGKAGMSSKQRKKLATQLDQDKAQKRKADLLAKAKSAFSLGITYREFARQSNLQRYPELVDGIKAILGGE